MKKLLPALFIASALFAGCDGTKEVTPVDMGAMKYEISGPTALSLSWSDEEALKYTFTHMGGRKDRLKISVDGLPEGVTASLEQAEASPTFTNTITFKSLAMKDGVYPVKISGKDGDSIKSYNLQLTIDNPDCADDIVGKVKTAWACAFITEDNEILPTSKEREVVFKTIRFADNSGKHWKVSGVRARLDCSNNSIIINMTEPLAGESIPATTTLPWYIHGNGTFSADGISLNISAYDVPVGTTTPTRIGTCTASMSKY